MDSSVAKCFLVPMWWGHKDGGKHYDAVHKSLLLCHSRNGPSARIVVWRNYLGFDPRVAKRNLGELIRARRIERREFEVDEIESENQSFLGSLLGKALSTYVNSQLESCSELEVQIAGSNQEIFRGQVQKVKISARQAVYKGISLSHVDLSAGSIKISLGKKRVIDDPVYVKASISIGEEDLKASLGSPLVADFLDMLLPQRFRTTQSLSEVEVGLQEGVMVLTDNPRSSNSRRAVHQPVALSFEIKDGGRTVSVNRVGDDKSRGGEKSFAVGPDTSIKELGILNSNLVIQGEFFITP